MCTVNNYIMSIKVYMFNEIKIPISTLNNITFESKIKSTCLFNINISSKNMKYT